MRTREPNGRLQRDYDLISPAQVRRLRDAALRGLREPEWGTELGRLFLTHSITATQYAAGKRWRAIARKYHAAIGVFPVKSISLIRQGAGQDPDPDSREGKLQAKREGNNLERFIEAHCALTASGAETPVRQLAERDVGPAGMHELIKLRKGLDALARHWQLDNR